MGHVTEKTRQKTFTGCHRCRARKVKCDGSRPVCMRCTKICKECPGYDPTFIWVKPNQEISKAQGLGGLPSEQTWKDYRMYTLDEVERVLVRLDHDIDTVLKSPGRGRSTCPFSVLDLQLTSNVPSTPERPKNAMSRRLFHHYITIIAPMMMPLYSSHNPWKTHYPMLASNQDSPLNTVVWHAILSQAAAHLLHLGSEKAAMKELAIHHRLAAISILRACIDEDGTLVFEVMLASILSLIMAEVYEGGSKDWRHHLSGAWKFATGRLSDLPWASSEMAWLTAQSLCLLRLRTETLLAARVVGAMAVSEGSRAKSLIRSVRQRPDFGFTTGTSAEVAACLDDCNSLIQETRANNGYLTVDHKLQIHEITERLLQEANSDSINSPDQAWLHKRIFALGTIIYLHRQTQNPPPYALLAFTSSVFHAIADFIALVDHHTDAVTPASITLWPVFMAAVECYRKVELGVAESWLRSLSISGVGNRVDIRRVIEEVWAERSRRAALLCNPDANLVQFEETLGTMAIDWRPIMQAMGLDLLLV